MSRGKLPHISRRASAISSSVKSTFRSSRRPSRLRNFLGEPLLSWRERTKSSTSFCFSGGNSRRFCRTFSSMVMDGLNGGLTHYTLVCGKDGRRASCAEEVGLEAGVAVFVGPESEGDGGEVVNQGDGVAVFGEVHA